MKTFDVTLTITGRASAQVEAKSQEEANEKAKKFDFLEESDELIEWEFDGVESVKGE